MKTGGCIRCRTGRETRCAAAFAVIAAVTAVTAVGGVAAPAFTQCSYEVVGVIQGPPCFPSGQTVLRGTGMNSHGHVTGYWEHCDTSETNGFVWTPETGRVNLPRPQGVFSVKPSDINDAGFIVGTSWITGIGNRGFIFDIKTQEYTYLEPLNGVGDSWANAINESNVVVGARSIGASGVNPYNAVIWEPLAPGGAVITDLGVMNGPNSAAADGNALSDAAGWYGTGFSSLNARAILWVDSIPIELGILPGAVQSWARAMNKHRQILGSSSHGIQGPIHTFLWRNGKMAQFAPPEGYDIAVATGISDAQQITGRLREQGTNLFHPYVWQHEQFHFLSELIVDLPQNLIISNASQPGNGGHILCSATFNGKVVSVVLAPINTPLTDLNYDCRTDHFDLLILLEQWGPVPRGVSSSGMQSADFNSDGRVDVLDLLILLSNWG